ncbi:MAG TPA: hypothetical protein PLR47_00190 [Smithellaceae bacterium]|nr:hypothetical protein [Smithellaceae bacterium]
MKYKSKSLIMVMSFALVLLSFAGAQAKWWIFGESDEEVSISYLFVNKSSFDETGAKITLFKEMLPDGKITISGKAVAGKGKIGSARVSLDGKETWKDANLSEGGAFEYSFSPETGKTYSIFVEVSDTLGKTNDVAATARQLTLSERNIMSFIREALDKLIAAYENHDAKTFMSLVSEDFAGDMTNLDRAIRKDFSSFDDIDLNYTLNNITSDSKGISVSLSYRRLLMSTKTGQSVKDKGVTEFVFKMGDKSARIYSMKNPLIFGITGAPNVATGTVASTTNEPVIIADGRGNVALVPAQTFNQIVMDDSVRITNNPDGTSTIKTSDKTITVDKNGQQTSGGSNPSETVEKGLRTIISLGHPPMGFSFVNGEVMTAAGDFMITGGGPGFGYGFVEPSVTFVDLGAKSIGSVNEAPATGYANPAGMGVRFEEGHTYAFKLANGKYGLMEVKSVTEEWIPGNPGPPPQPPAMRITMRFEYKYQPSGARQFLP